MNIHAEKMQWLTSSRVLHLTHMVTLTPMLTSVLTPYLKSAIV